MSQTRLSVSGRDIYGKPTSEKMKYFGIDKDIWHGAKAEKKN